MQLIGFWKEFRTRRGGTVYPSLFQNNSLKKREEKVDNEIIKYLKDGIWLNKARMIYKCPLEEKYTVTPIIYTDGEWLWTSELIYYYENYHVNISEEFLAYLEQRNYCNSTEEEIGEEKLDRIEYDIRSISIPVSES